MKRQLTLREALLWARPRTIKEEGVTDRAAWIEFTDGSILTALSSYESDYGENTPGNGIEPPEFSLYVPK